MGNLTMATFRRCISAAVRRLGRIALLFLIPCCGTAIKCLAVEATMNLPNKINGWTLVEAPRRVMPQKLFEYMDGAGELYLGYRFQHLDVYEYASPREQNVLVEVYRMESSDDAFGLLSGDWGGEATDLGQAKTLRDAGMWPGNRALYGKGLLRLWSNKLYARVMAFHETEASRATVLAIGRLLMAKSGKPVPPRWLAALPSNVANFKPNPNQTCFFRSHLVLNSFYFLSTGNILELDNSTEAVTSHYIPTDFAVTRSTRLLLIRYPDAKTAAAAMRRFEKSYLPEKDIASAESPPGSRQFWKIEGGWLGYIFDGRLAVLVFDGPSRESAERLLENALNQVKKGEARHE